jgi:hypothetical protein
VTGDHPVAVGTGPLVRPYAVTGGRTRARADIALEALVSVAGPAAVASGEARVIVGLCRDVRSLAEVSAHLRLPLGVTRVLVGDLAADGVLVVHGPAVGDNDVLLERVLRGLRDL